MLETITVSVEEARRLVMETPAGQVGLLHLVKRGPRGGPYLHAVNCAPCEAEVALVRPRWELVQFIERHQDCL